MAKVKSLKAGKRRLIVVQSLCGMLGVDPSTTPLANRITCTVAEAKQVTGLGLTTIYSMLDLGDAPESPPRRCGRPRKTETQTPLEAA